MFLNKVSNCNLYFKLSFFTQILTLFTHRLGFAINITCLYFRLAVKSSVTMAVNFQDICKVIFAFLLPPIAVLAEEGLGADFIINICLTILGWIPGKFSFQKRIALQMALGIIHALYILSVK